MRAFFGGRGRCEIVGFVSNGPFDVRFYDRSLEYSPKKIFNRSLVGCVMSI